MIIETVYLKYLIAYCFFLLLLYSHFTIMSLVNLLIVIYMYLRLRNRLLFFLHTFPYDKLLIYSIKSIMGVLHIVTLYYYTFS
jgi:hypothetical protein